MYNYYYVPELNMLARMKPSIVRADVFNWNKSQWEFNQNEFTDIFMGYDGEGIGNYGSVPEYEEITEDECNAKIHQSVSNSNQSA